MAQLTALLSVPTGVAVDSAGNLYIADTLNHRIRKVSSSGVITTVAGDGTSLRDNVATTKAQLGSSLSIALDSAGILYIADTDNNRIREVSNGVITTLAGGRASLGDNGPATSAQLNAPTGVTVDAVGDFYIADSGNSRIRKVSNAVITTVAGNGTQGFSGDNGPAASAQLNNPYGPAVDSAGKVYIADFDNNSVRVLTQRFRIFPLVKVIQAWNGGAIESFGDLGCQGCIFGEGFPTG